MVVDIKESKMYEALEIVEDLARREVVNSASIVAEVGELISPTLVQKTDVLQHSSSEFSNE